MAGALLLVALGTSGAWVGARSVADAAADRSQRQVTEAARDVASTLQLAIEREDDLVVSARGFIIGNPHASQEQFSAWASSVQALARYPEIAGLGFVVMVPTPRDATSSGPPSTAAAAVPTSAGQPYRCLMRASQTRPGAISVPPGYDFCAGDTSGQGASATRDTGRGSYQPLQIGSLTLIGIEVPVYRTGAPPSTVAARRAAFLGWVGLGFTPELILQRARQAHPNLTVSMRYHVGASDVTVSSGAHRRGARAVVTDLGNGWTVTSYASQRTPSIGANGDALALLLGGVAISVLLAALLYILGTGRGRALRMVEHKTGEIQHMALHDALTGLPNRALILDRVEHALARARAEGSAVGLFFLDLDGFKGINDTFGHATGDELLRAVAARLTGVVRDTDTVGRLGGDEFVILAEGASLDGGPELLAERIRAVLAEPFALAGIDDVVVHTSASIGVAIGERSDAEELLRDADIALYEAKDAGKDCYATFVPEMQTAVQDRLEIEMDLRDALDPATCDFSQFVLLYQPTFDLAQVKVSGVEALLRWQHPHRGLVMPATFIPIAEQTGLIVPLGRWVLNQACRQAADWARRGRPLGMSVNVSARQLDTGQAFVDTVHEALSDTGLDPGLLTLEITESLLMRNAIASAQQLQALKALGVRIAIDDFGTGYSSLAYLQQFPIDSLKIDRSFISGIAHSTESPALIRTLVQLGKTLGIETLAEGIEDTTQLQHLQREQCDSGQGYLFARPLPLDQLEAFVSDLPAHRAVAPATRPPASVPRQRDETDLLTSP